LIPFHNQCQLHRFSCADEPCKTAAKQRRVLKEIADHLRIHYAVVQTLFGARALTFRGQGRIQEVK
jgi:hypothetical protein